MVDLYSTLGIDKKASKEEIRKAYRKKARAVHPDTGGSPEKFALVKRAHDILTDEERRRKYDTTGDESEAKVNNEQSDVVNCLVFALETVLGKIESKGADPTQYDVVNDMRIFLGDEIEKINTMLSQLAQVKKRIEKLLGRFKTKRDFNYLENAVKQKLSECNARIEESERRKIPMDTARTWLKDYSFEHTPPQQKQYTSTDYSSLQAMMHGAMGV